jgi:hypothetical protein
MTLRVTTSLQELRATRATQVTSSVETVLGLVMAASGIALLVLATVILRHGTIGGVVLGAPGAGLLLGGIGVTVRARQTARCSNCSGRVRRGVTSCRHCHSGF